MLTFQLTMDTLKRIFSAKTQTNTCTYMSPQATPIQSKMQFRMDWGLEPRGFVSTRLTIKLDEMKLKTIYGNGDIQMI